MVFLLDYKPAIQRGSKRAGRNFTTPTKLLRLHIHFFINSFMFILNAYHCALIPHGLSISVTLGIRLGLKNKCVLY